MFTKVKGLVPGRSFAFINFKLGRRKFHALILFQQLSLSQQGREEQAETYRLPADFSNKIALSQSGTLGGKGELLPAFSRLFHHVERHPKHSRGLDNQDEILQVAKSP